MASPLSANISAAASKAVANTQPQQQAQTHLPADAGQVARASQAAASRSQDKVENSKQRPIQVPKRTEAPFDSKGGKRLAGKSASEEEREHDPAKEPEDKVDIVA